ncbi:MAG: hypothetical protein Q3959_01350 [Limosilactobacillus sp.]|uniref:hypothetical protein n=1 Tax=Limosilactobacillus sp. TaxID=2773925 RepID=UPI0027005805|nr:hypothetical protein [Limosilactobacillus sp.]
MKNHSKSRLNNDYLYVVLMALMTLITFLPFLYYGKISAMSDWSFHATRVEEIYRNVKAGHLFTFIATSTFDHSGVGNFLFYPIFFLYPWVFLRFVFNPIVSFYVWEYLFTFSALTIAYFSMKKFCKNRYQSFVFAILYVFNSYRFYLGHAVLGEFVATTFLPLAFQGFYNIFISDDEKNQWMLLAIGMTLISYSHVLTTILSVEVFVLIIIVMVIVGKGKLVLKNMKFAFMSIGLWILLSLPMIYIFLSNYIGKNISAAPKGIPMTMVNSFPRLIINSLISVLRITYPNFAANIGTVLLLTAAVGWIVASKNKIYLSMYILSLVLLVLSTNLFPWEKLANSPFGIVQLPVRYLSYACLFLAIIASLLICNILKRCYDSKFQVLIICMTFLAGLMVFFIGQKNHIGIVKHFEVSKLSITATGQKLPDQVDIILDKDNYQNQFNYDVTYGNTDYYPNKSLVYSDTITSQQSYFNGKIVSQLKKKYFANKIDYQFNSLKTGYLDLPVVSYSGTFVKDNGKKQNIVQSYRGTVKVKVNKGVNNIEVGFNPGTGFYMSVFVSVVTWLIIIIYTIRFKFRGGFNENNRVYTW